MSDTISRQAAIDVLSFEKEMLNRVLDDMDVVGAEREKYSWGLGLVESYIADMKDLPSTQPEPKWIPVTERLPKPNETVGRVLKHYLVQNIYGDMLVGIWDGVNWQMSYSSEMIDDAVAWMPLPECYRG